MRDACSSCGESNAPDAAFCTSCGEYLGWDQRAPADPADVLPATTEEPVAAPAPDQRGTDPAASGPAGSRSPARGTRTAAGPAGARSSGGPAPAAVGPAVPSGRLPAAEVPAGRLPESPTQPLPEAVRSTAPAEPPPPPVADPPCPECGTVNGPERRFCRRCGYQLVATPSSAGATAARRTTRLPWWRRLFRSRAPGATPEARRAWRRSLPLRFRLLRAALVAVPLLLLAGLAVLAFPDPVGVGKALWYDVITSKTEVVPATATGDPEGSELAPESGEWAPDNAVDGSTANAWAVPWTGDGTGAACEQGATSPAAGALLLRLERSAVVRGAEVLPGLPEGARQADQFRRPLVLELRGVGVDECRVVELADEGEQQERMFDAMRTDTVRVAVMAASQAPQPGDRDAVAITSIRLTARPE